MCVCVFQVIMSSETSNDIPMADIGLVVGHLFTIHVHFLPTNKNEEVNLLYTIHTHTHTHNVVIVSSILSLNRYAEKDNLFIMPL